MSTYQTAHNFARASVVVSLTLLWSCSGGGGGGGGTVNPASGPFQLVSVGVSDGATWELNRSIRLEFSRAVDPSVLGSSSLSLLDASGLPAGGAFVLDGPSSIVFEPSCPVDLDLDGFGFAQATDYVLTIADVDDPAPVLAADGAELEEGAVVSFRSADQSTPGGPLWDPVPGAPRPIVRQVGSNVADASRLLIGAQEFAAFFELDPSTQAPVPVEDLPLNLPSSYQSTVCVALVFDQPIAPSLENLARLGLEVQLPNGTWQAIDVERVPFSNLCSEGVRIDLKPRFVLPAESLLRVVVDSDFEDIVGEATTARRDNFALMRTGAYPSGWTFDLFEDFDKDPGVTGAQVDPTTGELVQPADWSDGRLRAVAGFVSTGGPGGTFDLHVLPGQVLDIDTDGGIVLGGPNGAQVSNQAVDGGVLEVRDLIVHLGGVLKAHGQYPLVVRASRDITILGRVDVSGRNALPYSSSVPLADLAGLGGPGAGRGGVPEPTVDGSGARGGAGAAPVGMNGQGGFGGESAFGPQSISWMLGGGGGGGCLAAGAAGSPLPMPFANAGHPLVYGAEDGLLGPQAGSIGPSPFSDGDFQNDFCGRRFDPVLGTIVEGELATAIGGCGGGAGGDSVISSFFPSPISPTNEYRGGAGGGGGGVLVLIAREDIRFGSNARMFANGGNGAKGQAFSANLNLGGSGGGGSGGWIQLEAGGQIDLRLLGFEAIEARGGLGAIGGGDDPEIGRGGDGSPGVVQVHVADPSADLLLPFGAKIGSRCDPNPWTLAPNQSNRSRALSDWISLPVGPTEVGGLVDLVFDGIDSATGRPIDTNGDGKLDDLAALLGPTLVGDGPELPFVSADDYTLVVDGSPIEGTEDGRLLDQPELLVGGVFVLSNLGGSQTRRHTVAAASYDATTKQLRLTATTTAGSVEDSVADLGDWVQFTLHPRHMLVTTGPKRDWLDPRNELSVRFQVTDSNAMLAPDEAAASAWTSDVSTLDIQNARFVRFEVRFRVDDEVVALDSADLLPALDFLRIFAVR
jgi:hypothetical protein